jgi:RNA exonuclease 4
MVSITPRVSTSFLLTVAKRTAKPFMEVQRRVADLLKDKILVGHAVSNDLKAGPPIIYHYSGILTVFILQALLLSHPFPLTRDTQQFAYKYKLSKGRHPALRNLTAQEFGIQIQGGEHSSVCLILYV